MDNDPPDPGGDDDRLRLLLNQTTSSATKKRPNDAQAGSGAAKKTIIDPTESSPSIQTTYIHPDYANKPTTYLDSDSGPFLVHVTRDVGDSSSGTVFQSIKFGHFLSNIKIKNIAPGGVKRVGRNRVSVEFKSASDANSFLTHPALSHAKLELTCSRAH